MLIKKEGLGVEKPGRRIDDKTTITKPRFTQFQTAIKQGKEGSSIETAANKVWTLKGTKGTKDYKYILPKLKNATTNQTTRWPREVNYYKLNKDGDVILNPTTGKPMVDLIQINAQLGLTSAK
jgi:hypothetical protein